MKIFFRSLLMTMCIMLLLITLISCKSSNNGSNSNDNSLDKDKIMIDERYCIVRPDDADSTEVKISSTLCHKMLEKNRNFKLIRDFYRNEEDINDFEILVGNTNRPESKIEFESQYDYTVRVVGQKIVINGASIPALDAACEYFCNYLLENDYKVDKDLVYDGKVVFSTDKKIMVGDQKYGFVYVIDVSDPFKETKIEARCKTLHATIAGLKYRNTEKYGEVILSCNGGSNAEIVSYPSMKRLWFATNTANNPHSVEITPDGKIFAVASSTGGAVMFYNTDLDSSKYTKLDFGGAHGVLYDNENEWFWIIGSNQISAYTAKIDSNHRIVVSEVSGKRYTFPTPSAHDVQEYYGDKNKLWVSTDDEVYVFDKTTGEFSSSYEYRSQISYYAVKGISSFNDGSVTLVYPDKIFKDWTSTSVTCSYVMSFSGQQFFVEHKLPNDMHIYKVRAFVASLD